MTAAPRTGTVLVLAYGNPGRMDDGLGPALAGRLEAEAYPGVTVDVDYQLTVEDAAAAAEHDVVIFLDAATEGREPFFFRPVAPEATGSFSTHSVSPGAVLSLAGSCFGTTPRAYALGVRGYEWNAFGETLSAKAVENLEAALAFLQDLLRTGQYDEAVTDALSSAGETETSEGESCKTENT